MVSSRHNHPEPRPGRAVPPAGQSSRWGATSHMMHASTSSAAQPRPQERGRGFAGTCAASAPRDAASTTVVRARCPPLTTSRALRGRPAIALRAQPYQHATAGEASTTSGGQGGGDREEDFRAVRTRRAQMRAAQRSTDAFDLTAWSQSWPYGADHDDEEADGDEEDEEDEDEDDVEEADDTEEDDEDEPRHRPIQGESSLEDENY